MEEVTPVDYNELEVRLTPGPEQTYNVEVTAASGACGYGRFTPPPAVEVERFRLAADPGARRVRGAAPTEDLARSFGQRLFQALFADPSTREVYTAARHDAGRNGLRVTLSLRAAPELAGIPWEFLYHQPHFLALHRNSPIVRYVDLEDPPAPLQVTGPLRILGMVSRPLDDALAGLDAAGEQATLQHRLDRLISSGRVTLDWLPRATLAALQQEVDHGPEFHVFHYIGHGSYDPDTGASHLILERPDRCPHRVTGQQLGTYLGEQASLRLVVLNACEAASTDPQDPMAGVATALMEYGIPAVVGMQFAISDPGALTFADEFYRGIADGDGVDTALTHARRALLASGTLEWGTPVLYLRAPDAHLFTLPPPSAPHEHTWGHAPPPDTPRQPPETPGSISGHAPTSDPASQASALLAQGDDLMQRAQPLAALPFYEKLITRYGDDPDPVVRQRVAQALVRKAVMLGQLDRHQEELQVYDEVVARYGDDPDPVLRQAVAKAIRTEHLTLGHLDRKQEAPPQPLVKITTSPSVASPEGPVTRPSGRTAATGSASDARPLEPKGVVSPLRPIPAASEAPSAPTAVASAHLGPRVDGPRHPGELRVPPPSSPPPRNHQRRLSAIAITVLLVLVAVVATRLLPGPPTGGGEDSGGGQASETVVAVPPLDGRTEAQAREALAAVGLKVASVQHEPSDQVEEDRVIRTQPSKGTATPVGRAVLLVVSSGASKPAEERLDLGGYLRANEWLRSPNGRFGVVVGEDGNLVLYEQATPVWASGTDGRPGAYAQMQADGNLVVVDPDGVALWATGTVGNPGAWATVTDEGRLVVYDANRESIWSAP